MLVMTFLGGGDLSSVLGNLLGDGTEVTANSQYQSPFNKEQEDELMEFVGIVLKETEDV